MSGLIGNLKGISLERLRSFSEVVRAGGISQAAGGDPVKQSLFSRQIKELETALGTSLFDRSTVPHRANEAGQRLAALAEEFFGGVTEVMTSASEGQERIVIGAGESILKSLMIPLIGRARKTLPKTCFVFRNLTSKRILAELTARRLDLGVVTSLPEASSIRSKLVGSFGMRLILPPGIAAAAEWALLEKIPLALPEGEGRFRAFIGDCARKHGVEPEVVLECSSYSQALEAVRVNGVATFVPEILVRSDPELKQRALLLPGLEAFKVELWIVWADGVPERRPVVGKFLKLIGRDGFSAKGKSKG